MREELMDKLMKYYYDNHDEEYQAKITFEEWVNSLTNIGLIKIIDLVGGC